MPDPTPAPQLIREHNSPAAPSDERLVALLRQGDESAFDTLATRYEARLLWFCWQILRSKEDAEDALQDVLAAAFRALVADEREIHVRPWLYRIARNRCINQLRRAKTVAFDVLDDHHAESGCTPAETVISRQRFRDLVDDIQALPDAQRIALLLREVDGFAYQEIAAAMETTVPAVKSLLVRARVALREAPTVRAMVVTAPVGATSRRPARSRAHRNPHAISYKRAHAAARAGI
jgi:RNA polymerase sigma factor (sigma-70 family)